MPCNFYFEAGPPNHRLWSVDPSTRLWPDARELDDETERFIDELRKSPTDLAKLVRAIQRRGRRAVPVSARAIARWLEDDPTSWILVREWLARQSVEILICE